MTDLSDFPISRRWPPQDPSVLQLYSFPTPNGRKVSIMLEETGLPYEAHRVTLADDDVKSPEFLSLNPNNKIPAIVDPNGPEGPVGLFESGAILVYLAEKTGQFFGRSETERLHVLQWLMFQMGGIGPMFGQVGFFWKFAGAKVDDPVPRNRYMTEAKRLLAVLEGHLEGRDWLTGSYSIADMATAPWLMGLEFYEVLDEVGWHDLKHVPAYVERFLARPAVQRGLNIPPREG